MRLSVLLKNDCNDTSQQNFFFLYLVTDQIPRYRAGVIHQNPQ